MQDLQKIVIEVLLKDDRFVSQEWDLLKNTIREQAEKLDENLIGLLLNNEKTREVFFINIKDVIVFDVTKFIRFVNNKEFLPDSYTSFKNKIGLTNARWDFITDNNEIVLSFPYKDCTLAWGQDKNDMKRDEIFYNEILGSDDIDRLLDEKTLTNFKRIDKFWEDNLKSFKRDENGTIKDNLIIKWNNLLALYSLKSNFAWKIKLVYIDPPYNTWNDSFWYNDKFNHSTWLTFMKNRLEIAKELLSDDWVIFVHCDNNEQAYLKVLMDGIFWHENFIETISVVNNPRWRDYGWVANMHEFITIFWKSLNYELYPIVDESKEFPFTDSIGGFETRELRNRNVKFNDKNRPNLCYPFYINPNKQDEFWFYEISLENKDWFIELFPAKSQWIQTVWRWGKDKSVENMNINISWKSMKNWWFQIVERYRWNSRMARSVWFDKEVNSERWTLHLKELFNGKVFDNPKPEETLNRIIEIATVPWDIVLDYHLWSWTTCTVAHKMQRQYIGIEQMDYIENISVVRMKKVIEWEQGWISKTVTWKWGWDFVYMELKKSNQEYVDKIQNSGKNEELKKIYFEIKESGFVNYHIDIKSIDANIDDFGKLSIWDQKKFLIELLDKNMLYVNMSEIDDTKNGVSDEEKKINRDFYKN